MNTTRRTVLKVGAWSIPVVSLATAAPAFATSTPTIRKPQLLKVWKEPGNGQEPKKGYFVAFAVEDNANIASVVFVFDKNKTSVPATKDFPGILEKRGLQAWGIDEQGDSRTPGSMVVETTDGEVHTYLDLKFLPWSAA